MFDDKRSKRVILVAHCVLNQNAKIDRCAFYPGAVPNVLAALIEAGVGIIQMPCPELICLGLAWQAERETEATVDEEDARVGRLMSRGPARAVCHDLANDLVFQVGEYRAHGFEVLGVIGINGSPACGVERDHEQERPGVFVELLRELLADTGITLPMRGIRVDEPEEALAAVRALVRGEA